MAERTHTVVTSVTDPLSAERLVSVLTQAGIEAFSRPGGAATADGIAAASPGYWDILVISAAMDQAKKLVEAEQEAIDRDAEANAQAAEEESMSGETPTGD